MIPDNIKNLIEEYCMGLEPTETQENEIMDAVKEAGLDAEGRREVVSYMAKLMAGPTREQIAEAEAARKRAEEEERRKKEEEERLRKEQEEKRRKEEAERERLKAKEEAERKDNFCVKLLSDFVLIEGGTFTMGTTEEQGTDISEKEQPHEVSLASFYLGRYEVTEELWDDVMGGENTYSRLPKVGVSWDDCQAFIKELNLKTGKTFRLPTEAEWEFAARGGNETKGFRYPGSNIPEEVAWIWRNSGNKTLGEYDTSVIKKNKCRPHEVGQKLPNELGLYDMCGNVWEWCYDWFSKYKSSHQDNPTGPSTGKKRCVRGGSFSSNILHCISYRNNCEPKKQKDVYGFRLAMDAASNEKAKLGKTTPKEEKAWQEMIKLWREFNCSNACWLEEGKQRISIVPEKFEKEIKSFKADLEKQEEEKKFWQKAEYKKNGWSDIDECVSAMKHIADLHIDIIKKDSSSIEDLSEQIELLLNILEKEYNTTSFPSKRDICDKLIVEYKKLVDEMCSWAANRPSFILARLLDEGPDFYKTRTEVLKERLK